MFEQLRHSLDELLQRATKPEDRRLLATRMKATLVQAKLGVDDLRDALNRSQRQLEREQRELETVRRRKELAAGINDQETVTVAERFERQHEEKVRVLTEKLAVQAREIELADRELEEMKDEMRKVLGGAEPASAPAVESADPLADPDDARVETELDSLRRERARAERDADADRRLEELKRKMGK